MSRRVRELKAGGGVGWVGWGWLGVRWGGWGGVDGVGWGGLVGGGLGGVGCIYTWGARGGEGPRAPPLGSTG